MATRSTINVKTANGVKQIYVHNDGSLVLKCLQENYNCQELAELLISYGDASVIAKTPSLCVFYGRDRGEWECVAKDFPDINSAIAYRSFKGYNHYWDGSEWTIY